MPLALFRELTTREFIVLEYLICAPLIINGPLSVTYEFEIDRLCRYGYAVKSFCGYTITDLGRKAFTANKEVDMTPKEPAATIEMTVIVGTLIEEEKPNQQALRDLQSYHQLLGTLKQNGFTMIDTIELNAIIAEKARLLECLRAAQEEKPSAARLYSERIAREKAVTDLLNALAAFELALEEEQAQSKTDLAESLAEDGYGSYAEGINWGYDYGARQIAREWQNCKAAIAKIGGESHE